MKQACPLTAWPPKRALLAIAGAVTLLSAALAAALSPWFLLLAAFVGVNQWLYVVAGACPVWFVLTRVVWLRKIEEVVG